MLRQRHPPRKLVQPISHLHLHFFHLTFSILMRFCPEKVPLCQFYHHFPSPAGGAVTSTVEPWRRLKSPRGCVCSFCLFAPPISLMLGKTAPSGRSRCGAWLYRGIGSERASSVISMNGCSCHTNRGKEVPKNLISWLTGGQKVKLDIDNSWRRC